MFRAAFIGWLIGKLIAGLMRGVMQLVKGVAYFVGTVGRLTAALMSGKPTSASSPSCD